MRSLCQPKQAEIDSYWMKLREVFTSYLEQHSPIMGLYQSLQEKDSFYQRDIARNDYQIQQAAASKFEFDIFYILSSYLILHATSPALVIKKIFLRQKLVGT